MVANPDRAESQLSLAVRVPVGIIYFVDKGSICGTIAKFCRDWQCDVGLVIEPGVRQAAES